MKSLSLGNLSSGIVQRSAELRILSVRILLVIRYCCAWYSLTCKCVPSGEHIRLVYFYCLLNTNVPLLIHLKPGDGIWVVAGN